VLRFNPTIPPNSQQGKSVISKSLFINSMVSIVSIVSFLFLTISFTIGSYVSWTLGAIFYALQYVPEDLLNTFDKNVLRMRGRPPRFEKIIEDFERGVLVFSDQQLIAAIGILATGFFKINELTVIDFQTIIYLAWMSSSMHLSSLSILRAYFHRYFWLRVWKLSMMFCLLVMLCIAYYPTTDFQWASSVLNVGSACPNTTSCPALTTSVMSLWAYAREHNNEWLAPQGVLGYIVLIVSYLWQAMMLIKSTHKFSRQILRRPLSLLEKIVYKTLSGHKRKPGSQKTTATAIGHFLASMFMLWHFWISWARTPSFFSRIWSVSYGEPINYFFRALVHCQDV
jgi:hypothetical protein